MFKAHRLWYHSTLGLRETEEKKTWLAGGVAPDGGDVEEVELRVVLQELACSAFSAQGVSHRDTRREWSVSRQKCNLCSLRVAGSRTSSNASETCLFSVWAQGIHGHLAHMKPPTPLGLP